MDEWMLDNIEEKINIILDGGVQGCGMECIVREDFDMECGICLEGGEYSFQGVDFRG